MTEDPLDNAATPAPDDREIRLRRLRMRSCRRGMKEMDVILSRYVDRRLHALTEAELDAYERLLSENDQDIYAWILARSAGRPGGPDEHDKALALIVLDLPGR